jgi:hypothetical protein
MFASAIMLLVPEKSLFQDPTPAAAIRPAHNCRKVLEIRYGSAKIA